MEILNEKRLSRMMAIRSFKVIEYGGEPATKFIPTDTLAREALYKTFLDEGIELPDYESFKRKHLRKKDLKVLLEDWYIIFDYRGSRYKMKFKKGFCFDGASVPVIFRLGNVTAHNSFVSLGAPVHDALFAMKFMEYDDANNVFSGLLRFKKINKFALVRYMLGVRSPVGRRLYRKSDPETSWMQGFVTFKNED